MCVSTSPFLGQIIPNKSLPYLAKIVFGGSLEILPKLSDGQDGRWRWSKESVELNSSQLMVRLTRRRNGQQEYDVYVKKYFTGENLSKAKSIFYEKEVNNENATEENQQYFDKKVFSYPKPIYTIEKLLGIIGDKEGFFLDFFSGSATTADAVMRLNSKDDGNRKYILVQLAENLDENLKNDPSNQITKNAIEFCEENGLPHYLTEIAKERIRRAGKKIKEENSNATNLDVGFRVFKLDSSNMKDVYYNPSELEQADLFDLENNIEDGRTPEDLLFQVMLEMGVELSADIKVIEVDGKKVFNVNDGNLVCCFDDNITSATAEQIAKMNPLYAVFRDSSMANDSTSINYEQIFKTYSPTTAKVKVL